MINSNRIIFNEDSFKPNVFEYEEGKTNFTSSIQNEINNIMNETSKYLLDYPVVYIHCWKDETKNAYKVYVGETIDIVQRTQEHYKSGFDESKWQNELVLNLNNSTMYVIGNRFFNKSLTLDIENRLIEYLSANDKVMQINSRGNAQNNYFLKNYLDKFFYQIWKDLAKRNKEVFIEESIIKNSAIFKASPFHELNNEQKEAKKLIMEKVYENLNSPITDHQLIIVEGNPGSGKTVLTSSTFFEVLNLESDHKISSALIVNHDEQYTIYKGMVDKFNLRNKEEDEIVYKPTQFINRYKNKEIDIAFIDEGHLLLTQGKQSYTGKNQLDDIIKIAKITVLMFDKYQVLNREEYWEEEKLKEIFAFAGENIIHLSNQLRMICSDETVNFINAFVKKNIILPLKLKSNKDHKGYEIKLYDDPNILFNDIKYKYLHGSSLSRVIASYDWEYKANDKNKIYCVEIGEFKKPWNREIEVSKEQKKLNKGKSWCEQPQTIDEIGSTYTVHGFDLEYAGVIIGPSVQYRNNKIVFDPSKSFNQKAKEQRTLSNGKKADFSIDFLRNELHILLTRGVKGLYIYACDKELRDALKKYIINI